MGRHCLGLLLCILVLEGFAAELPLISMSSSALRGVSNQTLATRRELEGNNSNSGNNNNPKRVTWNNCKCKKKWTFEEVGTCTTSCCNLDNDTLGEWCMVADEACEESDWGYCRPKDYRPTPCQDSPPGWVDAEVDGCAMYGMNSWCNATGGYGIGWDKTWGTFQDFANQGHTAATACCNCGGGANVSEQCTDTPGWKDSDGDGCASYQSAAWCDHMGGYGVGWHEEWGTFYNYTNGGTTAFDACCACGGGKFSAAARPDDTETAARSRTTMLGCSCKKEWQDEITGKNCNSYCCNPDEDPNGLWCYVDDMFCEDADWGYCRDARPNAEPCSDTPPAWSDSYGYSCNDYATMQFCTHVGGYGTGWKDDWGTFDQYWHDGHTAYTACCACGGGGARSDTGYDSGCQDKQSWNDTDGDTCGSYRDDQWCTPTGGYGWGWHEEWGTFADHAKELSAPQACCACGGGSTNNFQANPNAKGLEPTPTLAPGATTTTNAPSASSGDARKTWNGCDCLQTWKEADLSCENYCCNPDQDEYGNWCFVADENCEEASWGYCIPLGGNNEHSGCTDLQGWFDNEGDGCWIYADEGWCKEDGTPGAKWDKDWGALDDYFSQGHSATTACCACGGGNRDQTPKDVCNDVPSWKDGDGDGCDAYEEFKWCTSAGEYGIGWHEEWGTFRGEPTAPKACCYCGGGTGGDKDATQMLGATAPEATGGGAAVTKEAQDAVDNSGGAAAGGVAAVFVVVIVAGLLGGWYFYRSKKAKGWAAESAHLRPEGSPVVQGNDMPGPGAMGIGKKYQPCEDL